jgi:hypothetical protein
MSPDERLVITNARLLAAAALTFLVLWPVAMAAAGNPPAAQTLAATAISDTAATLTASVGQNGDHKTSYFFEYGVKPDYGQSTPEASLPRGTQTVTATVSGLQPDTVYRFRVRASSADGNTDGDTLTFKTTGSASTTDTSPGTSPDADLPGGPADPLTAGDKPALGTSVVIAPLRGTIKIKVPGAAGYTELAAGDSVPTGTVVDARHGTVRLTSALPGGESQSGEFRGAMFKVRQAPTGRGMTDLVLQGENFNLCPRTTRRGGVRAAATAPRALPKRRLWSRDKGGKFRTQGRNSVAAVRGTAWVTTDTCAGTRTTVSQGAVAVRDRRRNKTIVVRAGHSYLARSAR